jgi:hypothetical protein
VERRQRSHSRREGAKREIVGEGTREDGREGKAGEEAARERKANVQDTGRLVDVLRGGGALRVVLGLLVVLTLAGGGAGFSIACWLEGRHLEDGGKGEDGGEGKRRRERRKGEKGEREEEETERGPRAALQTKIEEQLIFHKSDSGFDCLQNNVPQNQSRTGRVP